MSEWREVPLGEVVTLQRGYDLPERDRKPGSVPVVSSAGVSGTHNVAKVKGPGVVTGRYGTLGRVFYIENDFWPHNTTLFVKDFHGNDPRFVYYLLSGLNLVQQSAVSAVPGLNRNDLHRMPVWRPPLPVQRRIAQILGRLDDKIEVNRRINRTLEAMARALYRHWFVDFGPFQDGEFVESELGLIPKGWEVRRLGDIAKITSGKRPKKRSNFNTTEFPVPLYGANGRVGFVKEPLFSIPIIITGRVGTLGAVFRINHEAWPSDNTLVIIPAKPRYYNFLFYFLQRVDYRSMNRGSTQPLITQTDIKNLPVILPHQGVLEKFHKKTSILLDFIDQTYLESEKLSNTRDYLLPRLLSGEIKLERQF